MSVVSVEQQTAERTQAILEQQIGNLVLSCAKFRAEAEVLREQVALLTAMQSGGPAGPEGGTVTTGRGAQTIGPLE